MKRLLWLLALPYVVTVTDIRICDDKSIFVQANCTRGRDQYRIYHLPGFQDCVSSSTVQCDYMYDIAAGLNSMRQLKKAEAENMAAEKREAK